MGSYDLVCLGDSTGPTTGSGIDTGVRDSGGFGQEGRRLLSNASGSSVVATAAEVGCAVECRTSSVLAGLAAAQRGVRRPRKRATHPRTEGSRAGAGCGQRSPPAEGRGSRVNPAGQRRPATTSRRARRMTAPGPSPPCAQRAQVRHPGRCGLLRSHESPWQGQQRQPMSAKAGHIGREYGGCVPPAHAPDTPTKTIRSSIVFTRRGARAPAAHEARVPTRRSRGSHTMAGHHVAGLFRRTGYGPPRPSQMCQKPPELNDRALGSACNQSAVCCAKCG